MLQIRRVESSELLSISLGDTREAPACPSKDRHATTEPTPPSESAQLRFSEIYIFNIPILVSFLNLVFLFFWRRDDLREYTHTRGCTYIRVYEDPNLV